MLSGAENRWGPQIIKRMFASSVMSSVGFVSNKVFEEKREAPM